MQEDPLYQNKNSQQLRSALNAIIEFRNNEGGKLFQEEYEMAKDLAVKEICQATPGNVKELISREQAVGQLEQIQLALDWFAAKEEELTTMLKQDKV